MGNNKKSKNSDEYFNDKLARKIGDAETTNIILEQYKTTIADATDISNRRYKANSLFLAILSVIFTSIFGYLQFLIQNKILSLTNFIIFVPICVLGWFLSYFWFKSIEEYRIAISDKIEVLKFIEKYLPYKVKTISDKIYNTYELPTYINIKNIKYFEEKKLKAFLKTSMN